MFIEKIKKIIPKESKNNKKKIENMAVGIVILVITIVAINYVWNGDKEDDNIMPKAEEKNEIVQVSNDVSEDEIEKKLANILSNIQGVGKVKVMITYSETSTYIPIYNENTKGSNTTETDSSGGSRTISEEDSQKEVIYKEDDKRK